MDVKDLLKKEYALRATRLDEAFEEGQPELYGDSTILNSGPQSPEVKQAMDQARKIMSKLGADLAEQAILKVDRLAERTLDAMMQAKHMDVGANAARSGYESSSEYLADGEEMMELQLELAAAFEDGFSNAWYYPIGMADV